MTRQNFFSDGIPQTGRWKTGRSLRWPPLGIPKSLPNLCSAVVACGLLRSSLDLGEEKHRPVDNASNLHPTDRYSALPGPPATVIQVSGSPSSRHRGEDDVSTREILLLRTPTLGSRRQVASSRGERGRERKRDRDANFIANRENPRYFRFGSRSESARDACEGFDAFSRDRRCSASRPRAK